MLQKTYLTMSKFVKARLECPIENLKCIYSHFHSQKWLKMWYLSPILVIVFIDKRFYTHHLVAAVCAIYELLSLHQCSSFIWWVAMNIVLLCSTHNCSQPKQPELGNIWTSAKQNKRTNMIMVHCYLLNTYHAIQHVDILLCICIILRICQNIFKKYAFIFQYRNWIM